MATAGIAGRLASFGVAATSSGTVSEIAEIRNWRVNPTHRPIDATSVDSSGWDEAITGQRAWRMEAESIYVRGDADQVSVRKALSSGGTRWFQIRPSTANTALWKGNGFVTNYEVSAAHDN